MREALRVRHYSIRTETSYLDWAKRFIFFHHKRHPETMGAPEITAFLTHLAVEKHVAASTQTQALSAILFLYREVLQIGVDEPLDIVRAKKPERLPVVLTKDEVHSIFRQLSGDYLLMARLLYGSGLRLMECLRLRVKDLDFGQRQILVRDGKGMKDRVTTSRRLCPTSSANLCRPTCRSSGTAPERPGKRLRRRVPALRPRPQIPQCSQGMALAVRLPF
jgi:site-specific recombinase XerD